MFAIDDIRGPRGTAEDSEEVENPLDVHIFNSQELLFVSSLLTKDQINVTPGGGKQPASILSDTFCEQLAFLRLFPQGKCGYNIERNVKLSPSYFNQQLSNYTQMFASDPDYIFYALSVMQQETLNSQISVALRRVCGSCMTAGMLSNNFSETVQTLVAKGKASRFMNSIKGTPADWKTFLHEILAIVNQLGLQIFFLTPSFADLR